MAGFRAALQGGCDAIEVDVRMLKDGVLILHHDPRFGHTVAAKGAVRDWTYTNGVDQLTLRDPPHAPLPLLDDFLALVTHPDYSHVAINLDIKPDNRYDVIFAAVHASVMRMGGSDYLRTLAPRLYLSIYTPWHLIEAERWMPYAKRLHLGVDVEKARQVWDRVDGFSMAFQNLVGPARERFVRECRKNGKFIAIWTVNSPFEWLECSRQGVDAIITDRNEAYRSWQRSSAGDARLAKQLASSKSSLGPIQRTKLLYTTIDNTLWQRALIRASLSDIQFIRKNNPPSPILLAEKMAAAPAIDDLVLPLAATYAH